MRTRDKTKLDKLKDTMAQELGHENFAAMGGDDAADRFRSAITTYDGVSLRSMNRELDRRVKAFDQAGGRGVDEADEIDALRAAIAARKVCRPGTAITLFDEAEDQ